MKLAYITGCLGFIGSHLTKRFLELDWQIYGIDKCTPVANIDLLKDFSKYHNQLCYNILKYAHQRVLS